MRVLVTGGAGYIGSHTVLALVEAGHEVEIVDSFDNSKRSVIPRLEELAGCQLPVHDFDLVDRARTLAMFEAGRFDAVIHFAGLKAVGESVERPIDYYDNNLNSTLSLVRAMAACGVRHLVFSSSATVYGDQAVVPFQEKFPRSATSPYGWTKVFIEQVLEDLAASDPTAGWLVALLQPDRRTLGARGEDPRDPQQPCALHRPSGGGSARGVVGLGDYLTPDGTCLRDYIHVMDLAAGHVAALERISTWDRPVGIWNLGTGHGTSVLEVLAAFSRAVGRDLPYRIAPRRAGDIAESYADPSLARLELGWEATRTIDDMCADTWRWQSANPHGYPD